MLDTRISRRATLMGAGAVAAWLASPARALLQTAGRLEVPAFVDSLIARMTLEEKAGQLSLMASAWGGGIAAAPVSLIYGHDRLRAAITARCTYLMIFEPLAKAGALFLRSAILNIGRIRKSAGSPIRETNRKPPLMFVRGIVPSRTPPGTHSLSLPRKQRPPFPEAAFQSKDRSNLASLSARQQHRPGA